MQLQELYNTITKECNRYNLPLLLELDDVQLILTELAGVPDEVLIDAGYGIACDVACGLTVQQSTRYFKESIEMRRCALAQVGSIPEL